MEISLRKEGKISIISVKGRMDAITAPDFEKTLSERISQGEKSFLINLAGLEYISSAGLRSILVIAKQLKAEKGDILFSELKGPVAEVFKISGFHSLFKIFNSEEAALDQT